MTRFTRLIHFFAFALMGLLMAGTARAADQGTAPEAEAMGLITVAVDSADAVESTTAGIISAIAKGSPQGLRESKKVATAQVRAEFDKFADDRTRESAALFASDEAREGMTAFLQKRAPSWASESQAPS